MRPLTWSLFIACAILAVIAPTMALQELAQREEAEAQSSLTGSPVAIDHGYRTPWRLPLFLLVGAVGVLGSLAALRVLRRQRLRSVSGRLVSLLFGGMTLLDLGFLIDFQAPRIDPLGRAIGILWMYLAGAVLVGGSAYRLDELETVFGTDTPPPPLLRAERAIPERKE